MKLTKATNKNFQQCLMNSKKSMQICSETVQDRKGAAGPLK